MSDEQRLTRPIGWWLKEADARLTDAFDTALTGTGAERRAWQVLAMLSRAPGSRGDVVSSLASFEDEVALNRVIDDLRERGWVTEATDSLLHLTPDGIREHQALAPRIEGVRRKVAEALPGDGYVTLVRLLARLIDGLPQAPG